MPGFVEVTHQEWIAAAEPLVRQQFADLQHHIATGVHSRVKFEVLSESFKRARFVREVNLLGLHIRDVYVREFEPDGTMLDTAIAGPNKGATMMFRFTSSSLASAVGTVVEINVRLPLPRFIGLLVKPLLRAQVRRAVQRAAAEDKFDLEIRGYMPVQRPLAVAA